MSEKYIDEESKLKSLTLSVESPSETKELTPRIPSFEELQNRVSIPLTKPKWIIRPAVHPDSEDEEDLDGEGDDADEDDKKEKAPKKSYKEKRDYMLRKAILLPVFQQLKKQDLLNAMMVCRKWAKVSIHPSLWKKIDLTQRKIDKFVLAGIVRRQPFSLKLDWAKLNAEQFEWLISRLPQMRELSLHDLSWGDIYPLASPYCPCLTKLDVSYCEGISDQTMKVLLSPPVYHRPGHRDASTRLRNLTHLSVSGTRISNESLRLISLNLPNLVSLDVSECFKIDENGIAYLTLPSCSIFTNLKELDVRGCGRMTPLLLPVLAEFQKLSELRIHPLPTIPTKAVEVWSVTNKFDVTEDNILKRLPKSDSKKVSKTPKEGSEPKSPKTKDRKHKSGPGKQEDPSNRVTSQKKKNTDEPLASDSDSTSKDSPYRRSERKNKGTPHKKSIPKKDSSFDEEEASDEDQSDSTKSSKPQDIVTRSKRSKDVKPEKAFKPEKSKKILKKSKEELGPKLRKKPSEEGHSLAAGSDESKNKKSTKKEAKLSDESGKKALRKRNVSDTPKNLSALKKRRSEGSPARSRDQSTSSSKSEASPKERPERSHGLPRRLSTSQK